MATSPPLSIGERKPWWLTNRKVADKYVKEARAILTGTQVQGDIASAMNLLEAALSLSPRLEPALELKARTLLFQRRYNDVADMLKDYIPSLTSGPEDSLSSSSLKVQSSNERESGLSSINCFDFKSKSVNRLSHTQGHWRYLVLGQACLHLGLMEDAILLLQTGKRHVTASHRRSSTSWSDDIISLSLLPVSSENTPPPFSKTEIETISPLITHIKQLLRRRTAATSAFDAGLFPESIRHFSKILDSRRGGPQAFLAECYSYRASAYKSCNRITDSIADCNKALSLDPSSVSALSTRATLFESINCLSESIHDLEHSKLVYNSVLRERKFPGPARKRVNISYSEIPSKLCALSVKIQELKLRVSKGENTGGVDYYSFMGLRKGCLRSELNKVYLLLALRHKPERSNCFIERCEFADEKDASLVRERAKMSALLLYRLVQKGYTYIMAVVLEEEATEKQRNKALAALQAAMVEARQISQEKENKLEAIKIDSKIYQGVFCRDITLVGNSFPLIPIKYEALSC